MMVNMVGFSKGFSDGFSNGRNARLRDLPGDGEEMERPPFLMGKHRQNYGKSPLLMGESTISDYFDGI